MLHDQNLSSSGPRALTPADAQMLAKAHVDELFARQREIEMRANRYAMIAAVPAICIILVGAFFILS